MLLAMISGRATQSSFLAGRNAAEPILLSLLLTLLIMRAASL